MDPRETSGEGFMAAPAPSYNGDEERGPRPEAGATPAPATPGANRAEPSAVIEPPSTPDGTFVKVHPANHPLPPACEVTVNFQDYHRSSSKLGRFGKIVGIDLEGGEYLVMLDNFECLAAPMRRVEWRKVAT
ncbi:MAG: hypothetical protein ACR2J6_05065 [Thermoleophilaceae bacterium]